MIVDSSALVAILMEEPGYEIYINAIADAPSKSMSAASLLASCVSSSPRKGRPRLSLLRQLILDSEIRVIPFMEADAALAFAAYVRFGKGMGHPARLNILDSCAYALAARLNAPLLFKGMDFSKTDIVPAC